MIFHHLSYLKKRAVIGTAVCVGGWSSQNGLDQQIYLRCLYTNKSSHLVTMMDFCWAWGLLWFSIPVKQSSQGLSRGPRLLSCFRPRESLFSTNCPLLGIFKMWTQLLDGQWAWVSACPGSLRVPQAWGEAEDSLEAMFQSWFLGHSQAPSGHTYPHIATNTHAHACACTHFPSQMSRHSDSHPLES